MNTAGKFLKHIHYFRGFAIINIMLVHIWHFPGKFQDQSSVKTINSIRELLFHDSTIYFIFISGFLFYYLSHKFKIIKYYKSKFLKIITPYIFLTILIFLFYNYSELAGNGGAIINTMKELFRTIAAGTAQIQYWYIPFIALIFLVSPFLLKIPERYFNKIIFPVCLLPLLGTRTAFTITPFQYLYFFPCYLLGIYAAINYEAYINFISRKRILILLLCVLSGAGVILCDKFNLRYEHFSLAETFYYMQKLSLLSWQSCCFGRLKMQGKI